jgi:hypothetical protein
MLINALVEGVIDEAVARRLVADSGHILGVCYGKKGVGYIKKKINGFNHASTGQPILTLIDFMDTGALCPPAVITDWLPHRNINMLCRVVVREIESWLLADPTNLSDFLHISSKRMPQYPEDINDPKQELVSLARHSRRRGIRDAIVPDNKAGAIVGPLYNSVIFEFVKKYWNIPSARANSNSLDRCMVRLEELH